MTKRAAVLLCVVVLAACGGGTPASQSDGTSSMTPADFARGVEVAPGPGAFFRLELPAYVFAGAAWPDVRDVRVFNRQGESVPFARVLPTSGDGETKRIPLRSFRIESMTPGGVPQVELEALDRGVELRVAPGKPPSAGVEYLLAVAVPDLSTPIHRLLFEWQERDSNWRQTVTVSVSSDLDSWSTVAIGRPLMDLKTADGSHLQHAEVTVEPPSPQSARYWRLQFGSGEAPVLTNVEGETRAAARPLPGVPIATQPPTLVSGAAVYEFTGPQPVTRFRITPLDANSVLPLVVDIREQDSDDWRSLTRTVAYRLNAGGVEQFSDPVVLGSRVITAIRLRPLNTSWGSGMPQVDVERDPLTLVVNARGTGPFLLAWGSLAASDTALPFGQLVPHMTSDRLVEIPVGDFRSGPRELGGDARLTDPGPAARAEQWQITLVWVVLVGGAVALALLAFRVWREARIKQDEA